MRTYPVTMTDGSKHYINAIDAEQARRIASMQSKPGVYVAAIGNPF